jgi:hypothetical protein
MQLQGWNHKGYEQSEGMQCNQKDVQLRLVDTGDGGRGLAALGRAVSDEKYGIHIYIYTYIQLYVM